MLPALELFPRTVERPLTVACLHSMMVAMVVVTALRIAAVAADEVSCHWLQSSSIADGCQLPLTGAVAATVMLLPL